MHRDIEPDATLVTTWTDLAGAKSDLTDLWTFSMIHSESLNIFENSS